RTVMRQRDERAARIAHRQAWKVPARRRQHRLAEIAMDHAEAGVAVIDVPVSRTAGARLVALVVRVDAQREYFPRERLSVEIHLIFAFQRGSPHPSQDTRGPPFAPDFPMRPLALLCCALSFAAAKPTAPVVSEVLATQVALDRAGFSPGEIDGKAGKNLQRALDAFKQSHDQPLSLLNDVAPLTDYTITDADVAGPFTADIPVN